MEEQFKKIWKREDETSFREKHVPVVEVDETEKEIKIDVKVGEVEHPSEPGHFIQWIELLDNEISIARIYLTYLNKPKVSFFVKEKPLNLKVRIFCNLHGTWESE